MKTKDQPLLSNYQRGYGLDNQKHDLYPAGSSDRIEREGEHSPGVTTQIANAARVDDDVGPKPPTKNDKET